MKKFLAMILALVMALSLVACGQKDEPKTDDQPQTGDNTDVTTTITNADEIADVKFLEELEEVLADSVALDIDLHSAGGIFDVGENGFAHCAEGGHASGDANCGFCFGVGNKESAGLGGGDGSVKPFSERFQACFGKFVDLGFSLFENVFRLLFRNLAGCLFCHFIL